MRDYISYSQMVSFEKGKYYEEYLLGRKFTNAEMRYGRKIADGLIDKKNKEWDIEFLRTWLPEPDEREKEILIAVDSVPVLVKMDGFTKKGLIIDEYKTGKSAWTQKKVDASDQITIYSMVVWKKYKKNLKIRFHWIPTHDIDGKVVITGEMPKTFATQRSIKDYMLMFSRLKQAYLGIKELRKLYADNHS